MNLGKLANEIQAWRQLVVGSGITIAALVAALLVLWHSKSSGFVLALLGFFLLVGLVLAVPAVITIRQLRRPGNVPAGISQFANADQWNVKSTLPPASAAAEEKVVDWMGPMFMLGWGFSNRASITLNKETDHNPFNTLLVTDSRWDQIVASATSHGLQAGLADHLNFGLPYTEVQSFSAKHGWINPGLVFKLRDGRKMRCCAMASKQIDHVTESLSQYLTKA